MPNHRHGLYLRAHVPLHAGELVPGPVKPEDHTSSTVTPRRPTTLRFAYAFDPQHLAALTR
ncbi:hypothetical protein QFZ58_003434 [Streptomyces sp. B1I3]|nr:hypothetical protein [Streptomyces sp. B1I3]